MKPYLSAWTVPLAFEESPVTVSPAEKVPCTFDNTSVVCFNVGAELKVVTFTAVVPSAVNNSKVFVVTFLAQ